jgi:ABC-2 type transport system ATP-binding protein
LNNGRRLWKTLASDTIVESEKPPIIEVARLAKRYGQVLAVDDVSFEVGPGELFGFLGPNGAGKTTTINVLTGLARADSGVIKIGGIDGIRHPKAVQSLIGVVPDESNLYPELTGFENLCFCAALYGLRKSERRRRARELLETFELSESADRKFSGYSRGMKRRLTFAAGIIHRPAVLFLDEPTTGIDVANARQVRRIIAELHRQGTTVFLTTHYIEEAERLCGRISFIVNGRIVRTARTADLLKPVQGKNVLLLSVSSAPENLEEDIASAFPEFRFQPEAGGKIRVESEDPVEVGPLVWFLEKRNVRVLEARRHLPSLEDVFVEVTGIEAGTMKKEKERAAGGTNP